MRDKQEQDYHTRQGKPSVHPFLSADGIAVDDQRQHSPYNTLIDGIDRLVEFSNDSDADYRRAAQTCLDPNRICKGPAILSIQGQDHWAKSNKIRRQERLSLSPGGVHYGCIDLCRQLSCRFDLHCPQENILYALVTFYSFSYASSDTGSCHSVELSSPGTSTARCENQLSAAAPCQCFTSAGMFTISPG